MKKLARELGIVLSAGLIIFFICLGVKSPAGPGSDFVPWLVAAGGTTLILLSSISLLPRVLCVTFVVFSLFEACSEWEEREKVGKQVLDLARKTYARSPSDPDQNDQTKASLTSSDELLRSAYILSSTYNHGAIARLTLSLETLRESDFPGIIDETIPKIFDPDVTYAHLEPINTLLVGKWITLDPNKAEDWIAGQKELTDLEKAELKLAALDYAIGVDPSLLPELFPTYVSEWRKAGGRPSGNTNTPRYSPKSFYQVIAARWPEVGQDFRNLPAEFWDRFEDDFVYALEDTKQLPLIKDDLDAFPPKVREFYEFALEFEDDQ